MWVGVRIPALFFSLFDFLGIYQGRVVWEGRSKYQKAKCMQEHFKFKRIDELLEYNQETVLEDSNCVKVTSLY